MSGEGQEGPKHTWDVGQGEKGRSSPALCLLGPDPSSGALRVFFHHGCGSPTSTWAWVSLPAPGPHSFHGTPCWSCFPLPNPSTRQGLRKPDSAQKVLTSMRCDTYFRALDHCPSGGPSLLLAPWKGILQPGIRG